MRNLVFYIRNTAFRKIKLESKANPLKTQNNKKIEFPLDGVFFRKRRRILQKIIKN